MIWIQAGFLLLGALYFFVVLPAGRRARDGARVMLREEQLQVRKTREQLAEVSTHCEISRAVKTVTVPVAKEELVVEKDGVEAARIPICEERVEVSTRTVPLNDVSVYRREWQETQEIAAVLKKEVARIETTGSAPVAGEESQP